MVFHTQYRSGDIGSVGEFQILSLNSRCRDFLPNEWCNSTCSWKGQTSTSADYCSGFQLIYAVYGNRDVLL
jgi:hypothetical protein